MSSLRWRLALAFALLAATVAAAVGAVVYELTPEVVDLETAFFNLTDNRTKELGR